MKEIHKNQEMIADSFHKLATVHNEILEKLSLYKNLMDLTEEEVNELIAPLLRLYYNTDNLYESLHKKGSIHDKIKKFAHDNLEVKTRDRHE